jgi:hypothetical protein
MYGKGHGGYIQSHVIEEIEQHILNRINVRNAIKVGRTVHTCPMSFPDLQVSHFRFTDCQGGRQS